MDKDKKLSLDDPLGIADAPVPQDADDIHATNDPDEVAAAAPGRWARRTVKCGHARRHQRGRIRRHVDRYGLRRRRERGEPNQNPGPRA